jgi:hypothetical protein
VPKAALVKGEGERGRDVAYCSANICELTMVSPEAIYPYEYPGNLEPSSRLRRVCYYKGTKLQIPA